MAEVGVAPHAPLLLAASTKAHQKGFDLLVRAFADLLPRHPDLQLVILGLTRAHHGSDQQKALRRLLRHHPNARRSGTLVGLETWRLVPTLHVVRSAFPI